MLRDIKGLRHRILLRKMEERKEESTCGESSKFKRRRLDDSLVLPIPANYGPRSSGTKGLLQAQQEGDRPNSLSTPDLYKLAKTDGNESLQVQIVSEATVERPETQAQSLNIVPVDDSCAQQPLKLDGEVGSESGDGILLINHVLVHKDKERLLTIEQVISHLKNNYSLDNQQQGGLQPNGCQVDEPDNKLKRNNLA